MNKERLQDCKQMLQKKNEIIALDILQQLEKENKIMEDIIIEQQEENEQLKEQIEKMKCCENCKHQNRLAGESKWWEHCAHCKADSEWELAE